MPQLLATFENAALGLTHGLLFRRRAPDPPRTVLLYRTARLGDFINAVPAMAALRQAFPRARLVLMTVSSTMSGMREVTARYASGEDLPWLGFVVPHLVDAACVLPMDRWIAAWRCARAAIAAERPDLAFLLPFSGESALSTGKKLLFLRAAGLNCALYGWRPRPGRRQWRAHPGRVRHQARAALDGIAEFPPVAACASAVNFPLAIAPEARQWAVQLWRSRAWDDHTVVALLPGASFSHKAWPLDRFLAVCRGLRTQQDLRFVVIGSQAERGLGEVLAAELGDDCLNLAGATNLMQLAALLERSRLYLGNDSGPAHLAAALGCACVTIFSGIEPAGLWEPFGQAPGAVRHPVPCSPCFSFTRCPLGTEECTRAISVATVLERCRRILLLPSSRSQALPEPAWATPPPALN